MGLSVFDEVAPFTGYHAFGDSDGTVSYEISPDINQNWRMDALIVSNDDTVDHTLSMWIKSYQGNPIVSVVIPAGAGSATVPAVDVLQSGPAYIAGGIVFGATFAGPILVIEADCSAGKEVFCVAIGGLL